MKSGVTKLLRPESGFEDAAAFEGAAEGYLIGVLKVAADGQATGETGDFQLQRLQQFGEVHGGDFTLVIGIRCKYNFFDAFWLDANEQFTNLQLIGPDAIDGADSAKQHVVAALEIPGAFDGDDIASLLHHAHDGSVPTIVHADATQIAFGDVPTAAAERDSSLRVRNGMGQPTGIFRGQFEEMERDALRRLRANAGKAAEFVNQRLNGEGVVGCHSA
jgi:hypothetical protein